MSWLEALKNLDTETTQETEIATDLTSSSAELSETTTQQGAKSAKRLPNWLLALLAPPQIRDFESHALGHGCRENDISMQVQPSLDVLRSVEDTSQEEKRTTRVPSSVDEILEALVQRGSKSAKSLAPSPDEDGPSGNTTNVNPEEAQRTLVTTQEQLVGVVADLKDADLIALDLETTGLDPRKDSIRLLSVATNDATHIVDCQSADPAGLFPILTKATMVAHNALFDLGFLSSLGFDLARWRTP
jgi:hypothetical protein